MFVNGRLLALGILLGTLSGCASLDVTTWFGGEAKEISPPPTQQQAVALNEAPDGWIVDTVSGCATSNPQPTAGESIRWFGNCSDGKLNGHGTLIWYRDGHEVERNDGGFRGGELHGEVVTTFDDGTYIVGEYLDGQRNGNFMIRRSDGSHLHALYEGGELSARRVASAGEVDAWLMARARRVAEAAEAAPGREVRQMAAAPVSQSTESSPQPAARVDATKAVPVVSAPQQPALAVAPASPAPVSSPLGKATGDSGNIVVSSASLANTYQPAAYYPRPMYPLDSVTQTARLYAGRDGPWVADPRTGGVSPVGGGTIVISSASVTTEYANRGGAVPRSYHAPQQLAMATYQPVARSPRAVIELENTAQSAVTYAGRAAGAPPRRSRDLTPSVSPDRLFSQGYRLELAGQRQAAARVYDEVLLQHPSAPSALLANARLVQLRQPQPVQRTQASVVAVNSPTPNGSPRPASLAPSRASPASALHRQVCSRGGLYESDSGWCGTVTGEQGPYYWVRVDGVHLRGFATIGITRSTCTGNNFLNWFSLGSSVKVPKQCMTFQAG